jgi:hypothetical protein
MTSPSPLKGRNQTESLKITLVKAESDIKSIFTPSKKMPTGPREHQKAASMSIFGKLSAFLSGSKLDNRDSSQGDDVSSPGEDL